MQDVQAEPMQFGQLKQINIRQIWAHEERDFTPWLARNLHFLSDALGMEMEIESEEVSVGPYRADILAKDVQANTWVLIENQLERTNHCHLGQIVTYAAGLKAATVIWIAENFTDEHIAALDWLNSISDDSVRFFALQIELWSVGNVMAPKFNVLSRPNSWIKQGKNYKNAVHSSSRFDIRSFVFTCLEENAAATIESIQQQAISTGQSVSIGSISRYRKMYFETRQAV